jgi:hypothetical protein
MNTICIEHANIFYLINTTIYINQKFYHAHKKISISEFNQ